MERWISFFGLWVFIGLAILLSRHKKDINKKLVINGLLMQFILALLILGIPSLGIKSPFGWIFDYANIFIMAIISYTHQGSEFLFGPLLDTKKIGFVIALQVLPTIVFFSSLMSVLYHIRLMPLLVNLMAYIMKRLMGTSGAESLSMAANVFVGQTEAPLVIKPYIAKMTSSELLTLMTGGMATIAGGVLAAYVGLLKDSIPGIGGHLLTASFLSAPAALIFAKILLPEKEKPLTVDYVPKNEEGSPHTNVIEAAASGAADGLKMALNVGAMLLAFIALIALINGILSHIGQWIQFDQWGAHLSPIQISQQGATTTAAASTTPTLSFQWLLGWLFAPFAFFMGVPWSEASLAGALLGEKVVLNEFVAYVHLGQLSDQLSERTMILLSYALCGFANFSSIAIQIGGIGEIAPDRRADLARFGIRSVIGGTLAAFMTACFAGLLI